MSDAVKRRYNSTRRQEQARENQRRILRAARELFIERGYGQTTITDVAASAGVAVETVYSAFRHARAAVATGQLGVSEEECRDILWSTTDGSLWHRLVQERGWTDERYAAWLGTLWTSTLVT